MGESKERKGEKEGGGEVVRQREGEGGTEGERLE